MPGEVAEIALMTDSLGLSGAPPDRVSPLAHLVERAKAGDLAAFEQIVETCQRGVLTTAWRMLGNREDARDAAQEVFLRVFKYVGGFRTDQDFRAWLYRIVVNVCRDYARARGRHGQFDSLEERQDLESLLTSNDDAEGALIKVQEHAIVMQALNTLSTKERAAIVLRDLEGLTTREVARVLGSTETTVRSQISSARAKIKIYRDRVLASTRRG